MKKFMGMYYYLLFFCILLYLAERCLLTVDGFLVSRYILEALFNFSTPLISFAAMNFLIFSVFFYPSLV